MDDRIGFQHEQESATGAHQRTADRDSMFLQARMVRTGAPDLFVRVRNLSAGGLMAETDHPFTIGEAVSVELRTIGLIGARIAWVHNKRVGLSFDHAIDPKQARKAPLQSPGSTIMLIPKVVDARRPGVRKP